jgi:hypothetical protein
MMISEQLQGLVDNEALEQIACITDYCSRLSMVRIQDDAEYLEAGRVLLHLRTMRDDIGITKHRLVAGISWEDKDLVDAHFKAVSEMVAALDLRWSEELGRYYGQLCRAAVRTEASEIRKADQVETKPPAKGRIIGYTSDGHGMQPIYEQAPPVDQMGRVASVAEPLKPAGLTFGMSYRARVVDQDKAVAACMASPERRKMVTIDTDELEREQWRQRGGLSVAGIEFEERYRPRREAEK